MTYVSDLLSARAHVLFSSPLQPMKNNQLGMNTDDVHPRGGLGQSKISVHASTSLHRTRTPFSREDQSNVVDWLVQHHPQKEHRRGNAVWKQLVEDEDARPWNTRHSWQSWRSNYIDNIAHFDILISKRYRAKHGGKADPNQPATPALPTSSGAPATARQKNGTFVQPKPSSTQSSIHDAPPSLHDISALAQYFTKNQISQPVRSRANIFENLHRSETTASWSRSRSAIQWRDFYLANKEEIDKRVQGVNNRSPSSVVQTNGSARMGKRAREEDVQDEAAGARAESTRRPQSNGVKKRRFDDTSTSTAPFQLMAAQPNVGGAAPVQHTAVLPSKKPVILVPGTPPLTPPQHRERIPLVASRPDTVVARSFGLGTMASAFKDLHSGIGPYGIKDSPISASTPASAKAAESTPEQSPNVGIANGVPRVNGEAPAMHIFPHSLPSLTPTLRQKTASRDALFPSGWGDTTGAADVNNVTPEEASVPHQKSMTSIGLKGSSLFAQIGKETPKGNAAGNSRQEIFPHTLPHLTPTLRPGPRSEDQHGINEESTVVATEDYGDNWRTVLSETAAGLFSPQEASQSSVDEEEDELEGPSPMPYLGSDRHSSRSYSFSHGQDDGHSGPPLDLKGLAKILSSRLLKEGHVDSEEVDELADDNTDDGDGREKSGGNKRPEPREEKSERNKRPERPRYLVPVKRARRPSESPLFASSSLSDGEDKEKVPHGGRVPQLRKSGAGPQFPVKGKAKANAIVDPESGKGSARATGLDEESEREGEEGDSDKENVVMADNSNNAFPVGSKTVPGNAALGLQEEMYQTPDFRSSPKSLHFSGKTPPSPNVTATSIKPQGGLNVAERPGTVPPTSKDVATVLEQYAKTFPDLGVHKNENEKQTLLKAALSYPSPNIPSELEDAWRKAEEPSPLQRLSEKASEMAGKGAKDDNHLFGAGKSRHGKVRFDGITIDRDRRKTTGGIGVTFGGGGGSKGIVSDAVAGPSHPRFTADPELFGSQRRSSARADSGSQDILKRRKSVDIVEVVGDGEEEEEAEDSPLAKYSAPSRAASSALKKGQLENTKSDDGEQGGPRRGPLHNATSSQSGGRSATTTRFPPPPPTPVRVPIIASSSSPLPGSSPPVRGADRNLAGSSPLVRGADRNIDLGGRMSMRGLGTATWSPVRLGQRQPLGSQAGEGVERLAPPGSQRSSVSIRSHRSLLSDALRKGLIAEPGGQGLSIEFRDQDADANWVATVRGRPSITSKEIERTRRSAPILSEADAVVFSSHSRSPSRARSGSRSLSRRGRTSGSGGGKALSTISEIDQQRVLAWLEESRVEDGSGEEEEESEKILEGLGLLFEEMGANTGFVTSVPRNVWKECGDLRETLSIVQTMTDAANKAGMEVLENRQRMLMQNAVDEREALLSGEVDGRRRSGRYSMGGEVDVAVPGGGRRSTLTGRNFADERDGNRLSHPTSSTRSMSRGGRRRPRPPSYVPAEVIEPLLSQVS